MSADAPRRLGRGLEALISAAKQQRSSESGAGEPQAATSDLRRIRLADIAPNRFQPREAMIWRSPVPGPPLIKPPPLASARFRNTSR